MPPLAVLLTDFGLKDPYVGQMKGVLLSHAPGAAIVDLCHEVAPFHILQGAFFLAASRRWFPEGAVFACVVDPGVGGDRRLVLLEKYGQLFLAPDNGLLGLVLGQPGPMRARDVTPPWRGKASATFHGRDLLAPMAARLLNGAAPEELGGEVNPHSLVRLPVVEPSRQGDALSAAVLHVDAFGNCILNLESREWAPAFRAAREPALTAPATVPVSPVVTYGKLAEGELGILAGSQGYLELAMNKAKAADRLGVRPGDAVAFRLESR